MFTLSGHQLCRSSISQLSPNSSTLLHPYVMKFAAQESHLRQSCFCRRENPNPHYPTTTSCLGRLPPDKPPGFRPNAAATEIRHKGYFCLLRCPNKGNVIAVLSKNSYQGWSYFKATKYTDNQRQVLMKDSQSRTAYNCQLCDKSWGGGAIMSHWYSLISKLTFVLPLLLLQTPPLLASVPSSSNLPVSCR